MLYVSRCHWATTDSELGRHRAPDSEWAVAARPRPPARLRGCNSDDGAVTVYADGRGPGRDSEAEGTRARAPCQPGRVRVSRPDPTRPLSGLGTRTNRDGPGPVGPRRRVTVTVRSVGSGSDGTGGSAPAGPGSASRCQGGPPAPRGRAAAVTVAGAAHVTQTAAGHVMVCDSD